MEWHPEFRVGRTRLQVSFTGGHLCGGAATPASFETSDPVVQAVIERSAPFRRGRIRLGGETHSEPSSCAAKDSVADMPHGRAPHMALAAQPAIPDPPHTGLTVMEFDDIDKASDFLQHEKGIDLDRLITPEQCHEEARRLGLQLKLKTPPSR